MHTYTARTFTIPPLQGISQKQIDIHLGLYQGYVKHVNVLQEQIQLLKAQDSVQYAYSMECLLRRLGWEFNGMRMHEFYFPQFEGGPITPKPESAFMKSIVSSFGSWEQFIDTFKKVCMSRGPGWAVVSRDAQTDSVHISWTTEHEQGTLVDTQILLAADMWEHAFMIDFVPAEKAKHVEAFLANINWSVVEKRME
jgi:superoxide dismutase, Fe-Mn family